VEQGDTSLNITLQDGDTIYISKAGFYYVTGEVKKPDAYKYEPTSVIKAITKAGGLTNKASARNVKIIRMVKGTEVVLEKVAMDEPVRPDDVIVVPESFF
jgi:polysaccharide export outer membrane protein